MPFTIGCSIGSAARWQLQCCEGLLRSEAALTALLLHYSTHNNKWLVSSETLYQDSRGTKLIGARFVHKSHLCGLLRFPDCCNAETPDKRAACPESGHYRQVLTTICSKASLVGIVLVDWPKWCWGCASHLACACHKSTNLMPLATQHQVMNFCSNYTRTFSCSEASFVLDSGRYRCNSVHYHEPSPWSHHSHQTGTLAIPSREADAC